MTFEECTALAAAGKVCQMMAPDGTWVKFDPEYVIRNFRVAPELTKNDGARVLLYALHCLEQKVADFFSGTGRWVDLPEQGHKSDPFLSYGGKGFLGREQLDTFDTVDGVTKYNDPIYTKPRLRDVFKSYFRITKQDAPDDGVSKVIKKDAPGYLVEMRDIIGGDHWIHLFSVCYIKFKPGDQYNPVSDDKEAFEEDWCIAGSPDFYCPEEGTVFERRMYTNKFYVNKSMWHDEPVCTQRIPTLSKVTPSGDDIFHNLARYVINYLRLLSDIDMNMDNFTKFIENNMDKTNLPTHSVHTPKWKPKGKSLVVYKQFDEFRMYRDAVIGKCKYDTRGFHDYHQTLGILVRYFNNKYHGTIDEVRES